MSEIESAPFAYEAANQKYLGLFVARRGAEPSAAFVLLPDWRGQSPLAHEHARFLVEQGSAVVIGDLYGDGFNPTDPSQVGDMVKRLLENRERGVAALAACVTALRGRLRAGLPIFRLELYGQTHHAFDNPEAGTDPHARLVHSPAAAARSRRAIAEFLREKTQLVT